MLWRRLVVLCAVTLGVACAEGMPEQRDSGVSPVDSGVRPDAGLQTDSGIDGGVDAGQVDGGPVCVDGDEDGYGDGCAAGPDCNDDDRAVNPAATEVCDGIDNDCDDATDEDAMPSACALTEGVCAGAVATCRGAEGFVCDDASYGASYEAEESLCDGLDNDCDGTTDEGCLCVEGATQDCGSDEGACRQGTQTCTGEAWGTCEGEIAPMGESCDGIDNDCDGEADELAELTAPACPLQQGVCAGSTRSCGGVAGWVACSGIASYGGDYEAEESLCDGLDNDCDGVTDEGCDCVDGATQACGSDIGACSAGTQTCIAGTWGACAGEDAPEPEVCNGIDDDCDGDLDNGLTAPDCALQVGVCAGSTQTCAGAAGFRACVAADYGANYEADETSCDGRDNDCDGEVDEGCGCVDGTTQACGIGTGACERGTQTCMAGVWSDCEGGVGPAPEVCDGLDNDCDGETDDNLVAPTCALRDGVCNGAVQTCAGAAGWAPCGDADYGADYVSDEDGAMAIRYCDTLDNDCDGVADEGCRGLPLVTADHDVFQPFVRNDHLVYLGNEDGQNDVYFQDLGSGETIRITNTPATEQGPRVHGNHVVYGREVGMDTHLFRYDLTTGVETRLGMHPGTGASVHRDFIVYDQIPGAGATAEIWLLDLISGTEDRVLTGGLAPTIHVPNVTGLSRDGVFVLDVATNTLQETMTSADNPVPVDGITVAWSNDGNINASWIRDLGETPLFPMSSEETTGSATDTPRDTSGGFYVAHRLTSSYDVIFGRMGAGLFQVAVDSSFNSLSPSISGSQIVWTDNRMGSFNLFSLSHGAEVDAAAGRLVIVEILADPPTGSDANGDGVTSTTQDEFVEIVNPTFVPVALAGLEIHDGHGVRHVFPADARPLAPGASIVVFGAGTPTGRFGGSQTVVASTGSLGLNNGGDTVTLRLAGTDVDSVTYGGGVSDESWQLHEGMWVAHSSIMGAVGVMSPGTNWNGRAN